MYDKLARMYEVNKIFFLKDKLKDMNMNKGEYLQSFIMMISCLQYQL